MSRLWEKGEPLDARVLRYTAGEDHSLDERLVPYDVRASIAHATMLHQQKLLTDGDLDAICAGLEALAVSHAAGESASLLELREASEIDVGNQRSRIVAVLENARGAGRQHELGGAEG